MSNKLFETDILTIGGGIAGLTLSALLGHAGMSVHVVEAYPPPPLKDSAPSGRTVALMENSLNIIKAAGAWELCEAQTAPLKTMRIIDVSIKDRPAVHSAFESADIGQDQFGFNIPNSILRSALYETVQTLPNVSLHAPAKLADYEVHGGHVLATLGGGEQIKARLIVGADGRNSAVRKIAGISSRVHEYNQIAITCIVNHSRTHENTSTEFHRPAGPLAFVPLPGNRSSVVWVEKPDRADALLAMKERAFLDALEEESERILGGLTLETPPQSWPISSLRARALTAPRTALIAEAAHVMSPITAQGLNLSLRDVAALAETLTDARALGLDAGSATVLGRYERRRRHDIKSRVFGVDAMNRIVSTDSGAVKAIRRKALKTLDRCPPVKTIAMKYGLAPEIDAGRLAKNGTL